MTRTLTWTLALRNLAVGGAVTAPVRQLAADTRRIAQGDFDVQFHVDSRDELAILATSKLFFCGRHTPSYSGSLNNYLHL